MSYAETRRRWQALQEIEVLANAGATELPWNTDYAEIFGSRDELAAALDYRLRLTRETQLDTHLEQAVLDEQRRRIEARQAGVLRMVRSWERAGASYADVVRQPKTTRNLSGPVTAA